ncbi:unnamed protein product [Soboliphyme baturini]|uniref:Prospero domain-containing protein n=1 Tax=Soboliphyme baturini TaxID=241478 RepID=A0A183IAL5_9BILA|nr:unnamed protein product [Soboliphyme baturini]
MVSRGGALNCTYGLDDDELDVVSSDDVDSETAIDYSEANGFDPGLSSLSCTLTPMHLRKAKLMFFFSRYPSSSLLKAFFPDIRFNKNNTAQLVKWFSNFR